jgi:3-oxoacyl-[acyl-carrier-protein] synthase-1
MVMTELPGTNKQFPVGLIRANLPETEKEFPFANSRIYRLINAALEQLAPAVEKALSKYGTQKIGVCFGSCDNGSEASLAAHKAFLASNAFPKNYSLTFQSGALPAEFIARKFNLCGPAFTIATACASGASAIMRGAELIQSGVCSAVIAGGADIVSPTVFSGFYALEAISDTLCNPFSKNRKGINLGEGASFFLLDSEQNSPIELLGAGESSDAHHMTAPGTDGDGPARAMKAALLDAGLKNDHIDYVNLHGTGTELNDKAEALAMKAVFDKMPPASSTKPVTGHTLGAAGALEAAICWMAVTEKRGIPVHCWDGVIDEDSPGFESGVFSDGNSGAGAPSVCMSNSFAFGGCNVSLILGER